MPRGRSKPDAPIPVSAIDVGSSAVRMDVAEIRPSGKIRPVEQLHKTVNLGRDSFTSGRLTEETIRAACDVLRDFHDLMHTYGVKEHRAVATSAVREADNRDTLLDRIFMATGLEVEVIEGSEENRLTYVAMREAMRGRRELQERMLLVEVGGGNAAVTLAQADTILHAETYQMGAIRLDAQASSMAGGHDQETAILKGSLRNMVDKMTRIAPISDAQHFVALGGDMRFTAAHLTGQPAERGIAMIPRREFLAFCDEIETCDTDTVVTRYHISYSQAQTLVPALLAYRQLLEATSAKALCVPAVTLRQGLLLDIAYRLTGRGGKGWQEQIISSAVSLGERYHFDREHAENVTRTALWLFDHLEGLHRLTSRDRLLLEVAAILHDIGTFISPRGHHKHTYYLVSAADIFGLRRAEMELIANIARYHRRSCPGAEHPPYVSLNRESRVKVCKLAALLRIADALDRPHLGKVRRIRAQLSDDELTLAAEAGKDWTMERKALAEKADLFENTFGRRVVMLYQ